MSAQQCCIPNGASCPGISTNSQWYCNCGPLSCVNIGPPCPKRSVDVVSTACMIEHSATCLGELLIQGLRRRPWIVSWILLSCCDAVWALIPAACFVHGFRTILVLVATASSTVALWFNRKFPENSDGPCSAEHVLHSFMS